MCPPCQLHHSIGIYPPKLTSIFPTLALKLGLDSLSAEDTLNSCNATFTDDGEDGDDGGDDSMVVTSVTERSSPEVCDWLG